MAAAAASSPPSHLLLLRRILRPSPSSPLLSLPLTPPPPQSTTTIIRSHRQTLSHLSPPPFSFHRRPFSSLFHAVSVPESVSEALSVEQQEKETEDDDDDAEGDEEEEVVVRFTFEAKNLPKLTPKEKKDLASYAHSLGEKLKSQQIGKSGITANVVMALSETLEANELLKLKIHRTCPGELDEVVSQLEQATGSVAVGQIGRTVIFYRPSVAKLEEKKKPARKIFVRRTPTSRPSFGEKRERSTNSNRGRRGGSRFS